MTQTVPVTDPELDEQGGGRSRLLIMVTLLALVLAGGGAAWWFVLADHEPAEPQDGEVVAVPSMTTTTGNATLRHARISMGIVLVEGVAAEEVTSQIPMLQDALLREVAAMDADQLRGPEGSDGLRARLSAEAVEIWGPEVVRRVVLTELLVQ